MRAISNFKKVLEETLLGDEQNRFRFLIEGLVYIMYVETKKVFFFSS